MLVDAANLYFRAFYALPESITSPDVRPVNAIRGFLDMSAALIERRRPTRWAACLDLDWRPAHPSWREGFSEIRRQFAERSAA